MNIEKTNSRHFGASLEVDGHRTKNLEQIDKYYNSKIKILQEKMAIAKETFEFLNSEEIKIKLERLPKDDIIIFDTHLNEENWDCQNNEFNSPISLIYFSENEDSSYITQEFDIEAKNGHINKAKIGKWLDMLV